MIRRWKMTVFAAAGFAMLAGSGASAIEMTNSLNRDALARAAELQALQSQLQRQQFQQQQQLYREQDRRIPYQPPIQVPKMKPSCKAQSYGNALPQNCR